jgi:glycosyltransferase involved in cell wall biosynthesis
LYANGLYFEAVVANWFLQKPLVQKIVGDWAWERAEYKGWVTDSFEDFQTRKYSLRIQILKSFRSFCTRRADAVIVPSRYLARTVANWGLPEERIAVIYNATESVSLTPSKVPLLTKTKLVTVGRLIRLKQIDDLVRALASCAAAGLVIIGDGPERERLSEIARDYGVTERVYFAGQRSKEETLALMAACDLFVLNSTHEGFPHVLLEAMSVGLPIVATAVGGTAELVRDGVNGILIAPNFNGGLAETIMRLLSSPEERQRLAAGGQQTIQRFRQSAMIEQTEAILESSLSRSETNTEQKEIEAWRP